jgi:hypothetical protein
MAVEKDFERLDDYLSNRLSGEDKLDFEKKLEADPELARELKIQQTLVEGIRKVRTAELKSMLNNIPVTGVQTGAESILTKTGTWIVVAGIVATSAYFLFFDKNEGAEPVQEPVTVEQETVESTQPVTVEPAEPETAPITEPVKDESSDESEKETPATPAPEIKHPVLDVYDPTKEAADEAILKHEREQLEIISKAFVTSSIVVETDHSNRKYTFHYMFKEGKLILYGAFEDHLYEILEFISGEKRTVVLFYKTNYYLLDIDKSTPTQLSPIRDQALLKKLKEYRGN